MKIFGCLFDVSTRYYFYTYHYEFPVLTLVQQIYYVKAVPDSPLQRLDLNRAEDEQFSPDKLRATLERFYTTIVVSLTSFVNHIARLRSWRERQRTAAFCAVGYNWKCPFVSDSVDWC